MQPTTLILPQFALREVASTILSNRQVCAVAPIRSRSVCRGRELLVGNWESRPRLPRGEEFPPLAEFGVLTCNRDANLPASGLPQAIGPRRSQLLLGISLEPLDLAAFPACLWEREQHIRLEEVRLIGPGLLRMPNDFPATPDGLRSSRTRGALREVYDRIGLFAALLVGAGRGGSELARQLVAAGLRRLTIIDRDVVGPENLDAMPNASPAHVGLPKAVVLAQSLRRNQPELLVQCLGDSVTSTSTLAYLDQTRVDTVFTFVDSDEARLAAAWKCRQGLTVHLDVGTLIRHDEGGRREMQADIRLFEPGRGCVVCVPKAPGLQDAMYRLSAPSRALHRGKARMWNEERSGSLLHLNALACSLAVELWLDYVAGAVQTSHWIRVFWREGDRPRIESESVGPANDCPVCRTW